MTNKLSQSYCTRKVILTLTICISLGYCNTFFNEWQLDDYSYFLYGSEPLHWQQLNFETFKSTFLTGAKGENNDRPVAAFTLAVNWYLSQDNVFTYHVLNFLIHILSALTLYKVIALLYSTPSLINKTKHHDHEILKNIFLFSTLLWAVNPVQTQAVTYIIQRMTSLSSLFYLLAVLSYIKFRFSKSLLFKISWLLGLALFFLFSIGSKQIAATLPAAILLIELIFFQKNESLLRNYLRPILFFLISITALFLITIYFSGVPQLAESYSERFFSMRDRLLTEPRIVLFYLTLLFFPTPSRLSISHDIVLSESLFNPLTTFSSILLIIVLLSVAIAQSKKNPIFSFSVLFFFLNHLIESTFLPLELIFEHRNYLPSLFIFWPIVSFLAPLAFDTRKSNTKSKITKFTLVFLVVLFIFFTFQRNKAWATQMTLWSDAIIKAPGRARPPFYIAQEIAKQGRINEAINLYMKSLSLTVASPYKFRSYTHFKISSLYENLSQFEEAVKHLHQAVEIKPSSAFFKYHLSLLLFKTGNIQESISFINEIISDRKDGALTHALLAKIYISTNNYSKATASLFKSIKLGSDDPEILEDLSYSLFVTGHSRHAYLVLSKIPPLHQPRCDTKIIDIIEQIENEGNNIKQNIQDLLNTCPVGTISDTIHQMDTLGVTNKSFTSARKSIYLELKATDFPYQNNAYN